MAGVAWLTLAVSGCVTLPAGMSEQDVADRIAAGAGLTARVEHAGGFALRTYARGLAGATGPVRVYIEGDGRPWRGRRPPRDPTPLDPMGLRLAARDPSSAVLWVGRPCMYLPEPARRGCDVRWWTSHRYAREVVEALDQVVSRAVGPGRRVVLLGHSGGGALATLLAARRDDVDALITVASPLDLAYWTENGRMTPLHGSLDPVDVAHLLAGLPQRHLCGGRDSVVAPEVVRRFLRAIPAPNRARMEEYPEHDHSCCWDRDWARLGRS